ncbi:MAG: hypothetical protein GY863_24520, partial [bacterium]|nr:hypothetical protein [bacterium]
MNFSFAALLNTKGLNSSDGNSSVSGSLSSGSGLSFDSFLSAASQGSGKSGVVGSSGNSDFTRVLNNAKSLPVNTADFNKEISASDNPVDPQIVTTEIAKEIIQEFSHKYISDDPVDSADKLSENAITNGLQQVPVELDLSGIFASLDLLKSENGEALDGKEVFVELQVPSLEELKTAGDSAIIPAKLVVRDDSGSSDVIEDKGSFIINLNELVNLLKTDLSGKIQNNDRPVAPDKEISGPTSFSINDQVNRDNDNVEKNNVELSKQKISFEAKENSSILGSIINRAPKKGEEFLTDVLTELIKVYNNENTVIDHSQTIITDKVSAVENEDNRIHVIHDSLPLISLSELALQKDPSEIKIGQIETGDSNAKEASFSISSAD